MKDGQIVTQVRPADVITADLVHDVRPAVPDHR